VDFDMAAGVLEVGSPASVSGADGLDLAELVRLHSGLSGEDLLRAFLGPKRPGPVALVSSFGSESALLLALVAEIDPALPIIFIDTGKLFAETLRYRDLLIGRLGLTQVRTIVPEADRLAVADPAGTLWLSDPDACCHARKVEPLERALAGFDIWISGIKRYQTAQRATMPTIELVGGRLKLNPLAPWSRERIETEFTRQALPPHPLEVEGFLSIGCVPCTGRVRTGEDRRAGRWRDSDKTECGIHRSGALRAPAGKTDR